MKTIKSRSLAAVGLMVLVGFGLAFPAHSQVAVNITGVQFSSETNCTQVTIVIGGGDCTYAGTRADTFRGWYGPVQGATYYTVGSPEDSEFYTPVTGDARIDVPVTGRLTIAGTGAGATVSGTFIIGTAARNVQLNPPARAVQRWTSITHTLASTVVDSATANGSGGFDYVIGSRGAPEEICRTQDRGCFGSQVTSPDAVNGPINTWGVGGVGGIKPSVGIENIEYLAGIDATGTTDQRNFGATTTAVIADPSCNATPVQAVCDGIGSQAINLWAPTGAEDPGYDNLILVFSTDATGNITAGRAYWTQNFRFGIVGGDGQPPGDDSQQVGTFTFAGAPALECADFPVNVLVDSSNNAIDAAANCSNSASTPVITIVTGPANGTASVSGANEVIYTPNLGFLGTDSITYSGNDGTASDNGVVTISVTTNLLPVAPNGDIVISTQGVAPQTVTGTLNVETLPNYDAGNAPATIVSVTQGALGAVTFLGTTVSYTPSPTSFAGTDTFTYSLQDSNGDVDQGTVTVNTANLVPAIENGAITSDEDDVSAPFQPVITAGNGSPVQHTLAVTTDGANGSCGLTAPNATGQVVYTPDPDFVGTDSCVLTDGNGDSDTATISVTVEEVPVISFNGGSSALDPWSLAFLAGVPLWRRRRAALKLAFAATSVAVSGVLALPAVAADSDGQDRVHEGLYLGAGVNGTSLQSDLQAQDLADILNTNEVNGQVEDFPIGGQLYQGWMFNSTWGIEGRWSATATGETDIVSRLGAGDEQNIGNAEVSLEGWTLYGVANWPVKEQWDLFAKLGYTDQTLDAELSVDDGVDGVGNASSSDSDNGVAAALGTRWRFARHWAAVAEGEYFGVDFDGGLDEPWRVGLNLEYWFGRYESAIAAPAPMAVAVAEAPPPPPAAAPMDSDGDGVVDGTDQCPETPRGDRVGPAGCSCDVTRQLQFAFGSAELTESDKLILDEMAESLNRLKFVSGTIEGHTDSVGPEAYNQGLSERRAQAVADYLVSKGIAGDRLQVVGRGESDPIADNKTAEGRAQNRRVVAKRTDCDK